MKVWTGREAAGAAVSDYLSASNMYSRMNSWRKSEGKVRVRGGVGAAVANENVVAIGSFFSGLFDDAVRGHVNRGAIRGSDIHA